MSVSCGESTQFIKLFRIRFEATALLTRLGANQNGFELAQASRFINPKLRAATAKKRVESFLGHQTKLKTIRRLSDCRSECSSRRSSVEPQNCSLWCTSACSRWTHEIEAAKATDARDLWLLDLLDLSLV